MGGSYSGEDKVHNKACIKAYKKSMDRYKHRQTQLHNFERIRKWKQELTEIISSENSKNISQWAGIQIALKRYIKRLPEEKNIEWIANANFSAITSSTYSSQFSIREDREVIDLDKYIEENYTQTTSSPLNSDGGDNTPIHTTKTTQYSSWSNSPKKLKAVEILQKGLSAQRELRKNLLNQISRPNHIVFGLLKIFCSLCDTSFDQYNEMCFDKYTQQHSEAYSSIVITIKSFIRIMKKFVSWIYQDLITQLEKGLDQEDINLERVIESVLYSVLFRTMNSKLIDLIDKFLKAKFKNQIDHFRNVLKKQKHALLESYDEVLKRAKPFLLTSISNPYSSVSKKIQALNLKLNPYTKFDIIDSLDEEMWECVCEHYNDDDYLSKLKESFGMDLKFPILIYCVVQSQSENLLTQIKFVEEFVCSQALDTSISFTSLNGALEFLLYENFQDAEIKSPKTLLEKEC